MFVGKIEINKNCHWQDFGLILVNIFDNLRLYGTESPEIQIGS